MSENEEWKERMFRRHADLFCEVLEHRLSGADFGSLFGSRESSNSKRFAILDMGCGNGRLLPALAKIGSVVVGLDYSQELLAQAAQRAAGLPNVVLTAGDFRQLAAIFPAEHFDAIVRAYTSLGYFDFETEKAILSACHRIARPGASIVLDTFNSRWFSASGSHDRTTKLRNFDLREQYSWSAIDQTIVGEWTYLLGREAPITIGFRLEGYDLDRAGELLTATGWKIEAALTDYDRTKTASSGTQPERWVIIAKRQ